MLISALVLLVVAFAAVSLWLWRARLFRWRSWVASAALTAWVVGVGVKVQLDRSAESAPAAAAPPSYAWPVQGSPGSAANGSLPSTTAVAASPMQVAPVPSLIGGLERRLAEQPDDAAGWALLAQSYAFMGDATAADTALQKAAALGMDEGALRERVDGATRSRAPH